MNLFDSNGLPISSQAFTPSRGSSSPLILPESFQQGRISRLVPYAEIRIRQHTESCGAISLFAASSVASSLSETTPRDLKLVATVVKHPKDQHWCADIRNPAEIQGFKFIPDVIAVNAMECSVAAVRALLLFTKGLSSAVPVALELEAAWDSEPQYKLKDQCMGLVFPENADLDKQIDTLAYGLEEAKRELTQTYQSIAAGPGKMARYNANIFLDNLVQTNIRGGWFLEAKKLVPSASKLAMDLEDFKTKVDLIQTLQQSKYVGTEPLGPVTTGGKLLVNFLLDACARVDGQS